MKSIIGLMLFVCSSAFAAEMVVIDVPAGHSMAIDDHSVKFIIDEATGTGSAALSVKREHETCLQDRDSGTNCTSWYSNILSAKEVIVGIDVVDKQVTFEDRVDCGKMGVTRIFKKPVFLMSGNCLLTVERLKVNGEKRIQVKLITKE